MTLKNALEICGVWVGLTLQKTLGKMDGFIFGIRLKLLIRKHGGADKVPREAIVKIMGLVSDEFVIAMSLFSYARELAWIVKSKSEDWCLLKDMMALIRGELYSASRTKRITNIITAPNPFEAFTHALVEVGDLSRHCIQCHSVVINELIEKERQQLPAKINA